MIPTSISVIGPRLWTSPDSSVCSSTSSCLRLQVSLSKTCPPIKSTYGWTLTLTQFWEQKDAIPDQYLLLHRSSLSPEVERNVKYEAKLNCWDLCVRKWKWTYCNNHTFELESKKVKVIIPKLEQWKDWNVRWGLPAKWGWQGFLLSHFGSLVQHPSISRSRHWMCL